MAITTNSSISVKAWDGRHTAGASDFTIGIQKKAPPVYRRYCDSKSNYITVEKGRDKTILTQVIDSLVTGS